MQFIFLVLLTLNVLTCIKRKNVHKFINRYDCLTHMCRADFTDSIQIISDLATFRLFLIENLLKIPEIHVVWRCFF